MNTVTVFSKSNCSNCSATIRALKKYGVPYEEVSMEEDRELYEELLAEGWTQAPIVKTPSRSWSGFRADLIKELV